MPNNIEIKCKPSNFEDIFESAKKLSNREENLIQKDIYFKTPNTKRLKLRTIKEKDEKEKSELIMYERQIMKEPKSSEYDKYPVDSKGLLTEILGICYGVEGIVEKKRTVLFIGKTRIHFDDVKNLGKFVEIEIPSLEQEEEGRRSYMKLLMNNLQIKEEELIDCSYIDLLIKE